MADEVVEIISTEAVLEVVQDVTVVESTTETIGLIDVVQDSGLRPLVEVTPEPAPVVEILAEGMQGPPGPPGSDSTIPGPPGPQGPPGAPGSAPQAYTHDQGTPAAVWTIPHNLGYRPAVTVQDSAGTWIVGDLVHTDLNTTVITFVSAFGGKAYCS